MKHVKKDGTNQNLYILLHGTGGDAESLFPLLNVLDPEATGIGIQGEVKEGGMNRFFARNPDGSFDLESLGEATKKLYETIEDLRSRYGLKDKRVILLGYSNGANIIQSVLKDYETDYRLALIFHPALVKPEVPFKPQGDLTAFVTSGQNDPYISQEGFARIETTLTDAGIPFESFTHEKGHSLIQEELVKARELIQALDRE